MIFFTSSSRKRGSTIRNWIPAYAGMTIGVLLVLGGGLLVAGYAMAQAPDLGLSYGAATGLTSTDIRTTVANIIRVFLGLLGIIAVVLVLYAGFIWMTAAGNEEKVTKAKAILVNAVIGLGIILSAYAIVSFVISQLVVATLGPDGSGGDGSGGGIGGSGNAFQITSIQPTLASTCPGALATCSPKNSVVRITFNAALASGPDGLGRIAVEQIGSLRPSGQLLTAPAPIVPVQPISGGIERGADSRSLIFTPSSTCTEGQNCFDPYAQIRVTVASQSVASQDGRNLSCQNGLCQQTFLVNDLLDLTPPTVRLIQPANNDFVPDNRYVNLVASAHDDIGVVAVYFYAGNSDVPLGASTKSLPNDGVFNFSWSTQGLALGSEHVLKARAVDISGKETDSAVVNVKIRAAHCFNRIKDADETGVDVGGQDCGTVPGGACTTDQDCWPGVCLSGICRIQPVVTALLPDNGKPGNLMTVFGRGFGQFVSGKSSLNFVGASGVTDDKLVIAPTALPTVCQSAWWSDTQIISAIPDGTITGPVQITNDAALSGTSTIPVVINNVARPGLCAVTPISGQLTDVVTLTGVQFGPNQGTSQALFGSVSSIVANNGWQDMTIATTVPNVQPGNPWLTVKVGDAISNPLTNFTVKPLANGPVISDVSPQPAPIGQYITILGQNFGTNPGKVWFKTLGSPVLSAPLPVACGSDFWKNNQIIAKVPEGVRGQASTQVWVERSSDLALSPLVVLSLGGTPRPNLCRLEPDNGPAGLTQVKFIGERFGTNLGKGEFFQDKTAMGIPGQWQSGAATLLTPADARTGPVILIDATGTISNSLQFKVGACDNSNTLTACPFKIDGVTRQECCAGSCRDSCGAGAPNQCKLTWSFTIGSGGYTDGQVDTENGLSTFQVINDSSCVDSAFQTSPSPHKDNNPACPSALVFVRFNAKAVLVTPSMIEVKKCEGSGCATTTPVTGTVAIIDISNTENGVQFTPANDLAAGATYKVVIKSGENGVKTLTGAMLDGNRNGRLEGSPVDDFVYDFTVRGPSDPTCAITKVSVAPRIYMFVGPGQTQEYTGGIGGGNCNLLNSRSIPWTWRSGDMSKATVAAANTTYKTTVTAHNETGMLNPVEIQAIAANRSGIGSLYINYFPQVMQECDVDNSCNPSANTRLPSPSPSLIYGGQEGACTNALVHAKLTIPVYLYSINKNSVMVAKCTSTGATPCATSTLVDVSVSANIYAEGNYNRTMISAKPVTGNWSPDTTYLVTLDDSISTLAGRGLDGNNDGQPGGNYSWIFKTKGGVCPLGCVNVSPAEVTTQSYNVALSFKALPTIQGDTCALVNPASISWQWSGKGTLLPLPQASGEAVTSLRFCSSDADCDGEANACHKATSPPAVLADAVAGFCHSYYAQSRPTAPTKPAIPHLISATPVNFSSQKGTARMFINFDLLNIIDRWPNCDTACPGAAVGLKFNQPVSPDSVLRPLSFYPNNVLTTIPKIQLFKCGDATCGNSLLVPVSQLSDLELVDNNTAVNIRLARPLELGASYRVAVIGGDSGIKAVNGNRVITSSVLSFDLYSSLPTYSWTFKMRSAVGTSECKVSRVSVEPDELQMSMYQRNTLAAAPFSAPDACDSRGQRLNPYNFVWQWANSENQVASLTNTNGCGNGVIEYGESCDPGSQSVAWCSDECLLTGSIVAEVDCGNGDLEPGEQCEKDLAGVWLPGCDHSTCLWSGSSSVPGSVCGNDNVEIGETCDDKNIINSDGCSSNCLLDGNPRVVISPHQQVYAVGGGQSLVTTKTENISGQSIVQVEETCETDLDCTAGPGRCSVSTEPCQRDSQCADGQTCERDSALACLGSTCHAQRCTPVIDSLSPLNGAPGTWVTIKGCKFGNLPGTATFLGDEALSTTITRQLIGGNAAEEYLDNSQVHLSDTAVNLVNISGHDQVVGLRFPNIAVPQTHITTAKLVFTAASGLDGPASFRLFGQAIDNAPVLTTDSKNISKRLRTNTQVVWDNVLVWSTTGDPISTYESPDLSGIVQEIISRDGWSSGNALVFLLEGQGLRKAVTNQIYLRITYEDDAVALFPHDAQCDKNWQDDQIIVEVPNISTTNKSDDAKTGLLKVTTARLDGDGNLLAATSDESFTVNGKVRPGICKLIPNSGLVNSPVNVVGQNFGDQRSFGPNAAVRTDDSRISFGNLPVDTEATVDTMVKSWSNKNIMCTVPTGVDVVRTDDASVNVKVRLLGGSQGTPAGSESNEVSFYLAPYISSITPAIGPAATWMTIKGGNFGETPGTVSFAAANNSRTNSEALPAWCSQTWTDSEIIVKVPAGAVNGLVKVKTRAGVETIDTNSRIFTLDPQALLAPGLCSITPESGAVSTAVSLGGDRFGAQKGANDKVLFTANQAGQFDLQAKAVPFDKNIGPLQAVVVPTSQNIWVRGKNGFAKSTTDGGTWIKFLPGSPAMDGNNDFSAWSVVSSDIVWASRGHGLYRTQNGGTDWERFAHSPVEPYLIAAVSANQAWVLNYNKLTFTQDGGQTFTAPITIPETGLIATSLTVVPAATLNETAIWIAGYIPGTANSRIVKVWRSVDNGTTWENKYSENIGSGDVYGVYKIYAKQKDTAWLLGHYLKGSSWGDGVVVLKTNDAGAAWQKQSLGSFGLGSGNGDKFDLVFGSSVGSAFVVGDKGSVYKTINGGTSWQKVVSSLSQASGLAVVADNDIWAVGGLSTPTIWHVTQGGWQNTAITVVVPQGAVTGDVIVEKEFTKEEARHCPGVAIADSCYFGDWEYPTSIVKLSSNPKKFTVASSGPGGSGAFQIVGHSPEGQNACLNSVVYALANRNISSISENQISLEKQASDNSWTSLNNQLGTVYYLRDMNLVTGVLSNKTCLKIDGCQIYGRCSATGCYTVPDNTIKDVCPVPQGQDTCVGTVGGEDVEYYNPSVCTEDGGCLGKMVCGSGPGSCEPLWDYEEICKVGSGGKSCIAGPKFSLSSGESIYYLDEQNHNLECSVFNGCPIYLLCDSSRSTCTRTEATTPQAFEVCSVIPNQSFCSVYNIPFRRQITLNLTRVLEPQTNYRVTIKGGTQGLRSSDGLNLASDDIWTFATGTNYCVADSIGITKEEFNHAGDVTASDTPDWLKIWRIPTRQQTQEEKMSFKAWLYQQNDPTNLLSANSASYNASWRWATNNNIVSGLNNQTILNAGAASRITAKLENRQGTATITATANIIDARNPQRVNQRELSATAKVLAGICENPWPSINAFPYEDSTTNCDLSSGAPCVDGNFSTYYCRSQGITGVADDLPALIGPTVRGDVEPDTSVLIYKKPVKQLKEFFLSTLPDAVGTQEQIRIRIYRNSRHVAIEDWYSETITEHGGAPQMAVIDGYPAIRDGRTVYINAQNVETEHNPNQIYGMVYMLSYSDNASPETKKIFDELVANFKLNTNIISDAQKIALRADTSRLGDLYKITHRLGYCANYYPWACKGNTADPSGNTQCGASGRCVKNIPLLKSGIYKAGMSVSTWSSWQGELASALGGTLPVDPKNGIKNCKACLGSGLFCQQDSECAIKSYCSQTKDRVCSLDSDCPIPNSNTGIHETCVSDTCGTPPTLNVAACWESRTNRFACSSPAARTPSNMTPYTDADSFVYMYIANDHNTPANKDDDAYELRFNLESLRPNQSGGLLGPADWKREFGYEGAPLDFSTTGQKNSLACPAAY